MLARPHAVATLTLAASLTLGGIGCVHRPSDSVLDDSDAAVSVTHRRVQRKAATSDSTFWGSVSALDADGAELRAGSVAERLFAIAIRALVVGDVARAEVLFSSLMTDKDPLVRGRARIGLTLSLEAQGNWPALAALPRVQLSPVDTAEPEDRAAVDSWAGVLRNVLPIEVSAPAAPVILPVTRSTIGTPIINVLINGHAHAFWLDTGASMSLISSDIAAASEVKPLAGDTLAIAAAAGRVAARPALAALVQLGRVTIRNLPVALLDSRSLRLDHRVLDGKRVAVRIDGVIGSDILRRLNVVLDMGAGTLALSRPSAHAPRVRRLVWVGFPVVRLLTRDGRPVLFGLDTGADSSIVTDAWLDKTPDPQLTFAKATIDALGHGKKEGLPVVRRVTVSDGDYVLRLHDVPMVPERRQTFVAFDGVLGANVLSGATIRMDMTNGVFEIRAPGFAPSDTGFVKIGH